MDAYISRCPYLSASDFMAPCFEDKSGRTFFGAPVREAISSALSVLDVRSRRTSRRAPAVYRSLLPADDVTGLLSFHYMYSKEAYTSFTGNTQKTVYKPLQCLNTLVCT